MFPTPCVAGDGAGGGGLVIEEEEEEDAGEGGEETGYRLMPLVNGCSVFRLLIGDGDGDGSE